MKKMKLEEEVGYGDLQSFCKVFTRGVLFKSELCYERGVEGYYIGLSWGVKNRVSKLGGGPKLAGHTSPLI